MQVNRTDQTMRIATDSAKLAQLEAEHLLAYLAGLPDDAWGVQSACYRWQVADVVAHLAQGVGGYVEVILRGLQGDSSPPHGLPPVGRVKAGSFSMLHSQMAISEKEMLGDQLLPVFKGRNDELNGLFSRLGPQDWAKQCYLPARTIPVWLYADIRFMELAIHGWDIRSRLGHHGGLPPESLPSSVNVISELFVLFFWPASQSTQRALYRFNVSGPFGGCDVEVEHDGARIQPLSDSPADVTFGCDLETFVLIFYGRLTIDSATADGRLSAKGDRQLITQLGQRLKGL